MDKTKISSNKSFGILFFIVFVLIAIYPLTNNGNIRIWSLSISVIFLYLGFFNSRILTPFNIIWSKFGILLGKIVAPLSMIIIFFGVVTPIGLFMRIMGKDLLNLKFNNNQSYWIKKEESKSKFKNQF
tara:strand:- start:709 stop:1092 length:384 start_codon:yes stop_codon:yes gene_type:complete